MEVSQQYMSPLGTDSSCRSCADRARRYKMSAHGAALQSQNNELVKCIEDLKEKREMLARSIREDEAEKSKIQQDLQVGLRMEQRELVTSL